MVIEFVYADIGVCDAETVLYSGLRASDLISSVVFNVGGRPSVVIYAFIALRNVVETLTSSGIGFDMKYSESFVE